MTPAIAITAEQRRTILALLDRHLPDTAAWACGSRVKGTSRPASDLDLVVFARPKQSAQVAELREAFEESDLPFRVDLFVWDEAPENSKRRIKAEHIDLTCEGTKVRITANESKHENNWTTIRLGSVCKKIGSGMTPRGGSKVYLDRGPCALIRSQNVHNDGFRRDGLAFIDEQQAADLNNVEVRLHDVLLNITGDSVARCCQVSPGVLPARVNQHVAIIRPDPEVLEPQFLRYALVEPKMQDRLLSWAGAGGTRNALTKGMIESFEVFAPAKVQEQRTIANILGTLDDKIELNRRMNETLEATARAIFKDWFIDFGPTRAKMESRKPYLPERLWSLFPDKLIDATGLPKNWKSSTLEDYMALAYGKSLPAKTRRPGQVAVYGSGGFVDFHDEALVNGPTVIVGRKGTVGSVYYEDRSAFPIDTVFYVIPKRSTHLFCYQILLTQPLGDMNTDAAVPGLNRANVYRLEFPWPGSELSDAYHELISPIWKRRSVILKEIEILNHIRDVLLLNLVSGKIRILRISEENYDVE